MHLLTPRERDQLLVEWNDTAQPYPHDRCIHQLFEAQALAAPEAVAVVFEDAQLTYGELEARANQLAHHLQALGVGPDVVVGLCVERSLEMVVGLLGILKAGGAYLPLDPEYPKDRLAFIIEDAQALILVTTDAAQDDLPVHSGLTVSLDGDQVRLLRRPVTAPRSSVSPQNLAYVIYTSGSTGTPKGVMIQHGNFRVLVVARENAPDGDRLAIYCTAIGELQSEDLRRHLAPTLSEDLIPAVFVRLQALTAHALVDDRQIRLFGYVG